MLAIATVSPRAAKKASKKGLHALHCAASLACTCALPRLHIALRYAIDFSCWLSSPSCASSRLHSQWWIFKPFTKMYSVYARVTIKVINAKTNRTNYMLSYEIINTSVKGPSMDAEKWVLVYNLRWRVSKN